MSKRVLTEEEKERWVREDYANGRMFAIDSISPQGDKKLIRMYNKLFNYKDFGSGDEFETKWWHKIWDYLELNEAYEKYWEDSL